MSGLVRLVRKLSVQGIGAVAVATIGACAAPGDPGPHHLRQGGGGSLGAVPESARGRVAAHNRRLEELGEVWCSGSYRYSSSEGGTTTTERGEGYLTYSGADQAIHFQFSQHGTTAWTIAATREYVWSIDHLGVGAGDRQSTIYLARAENLRSPCCGDKDWLHPSDYLILAGLWPIPANSKRTEWPAEDGSVAADVWAFPAEAQPLSVEIALHPSTGLPTEVRIFATTDGERAFVGRSLLSEYFPQAPGRSMVPGRIALISADMNRHLTIQVNQARPRTSRRSVAATGILDLDQVLTRFDSFRRVVLDANCPNPALPPQ